MVSTIKRIPTDSDPRLYRARPRGIGIDAGPCMVCGGDPETYRPNCSLFVPSRETGEAVVALFHHRPRLDYRPFEPGWVQVLVSACDKHKSNLIDLAKAVLDTSDRTDGPGISAEMVAKYAVPKREDLSEVLAAVEFGVRQSENGNNLQSALASARALYDGEHAILPDNVVKRGA